MYAFLGILEIFVNPWLLGGLALLASPVVIHLLNKRHYTVVHWAAMDFLLQADSRNRRRLRFEDIILLLLRMALLALVVFAVARPIVHGLGGAREDERIVVMDDSFSLEASEGTGSAFLRAKAAAVTQVEEAVGRSIPVSVWSGTRPELGSIDLKMPSAPASEGSPASDAAASDVPARGEGSASGEDDASAAQEGAARLLGELRGRETTDASLRLGAFLGRLAERIGASPSAALRVVTLVSDFRAADWFEPGSSVLRSEVEAALLELKKRDVLSGLRWRFIDVGQSSRENVAVTSVRLSSDHPLAKVPVRILVELKNFGADERKHVTGEIEILDADVSSSGSSNASASKDSPSSLQAEPSEAASRDSSRKKLRVLHRIPFPAIESLPGGKAATAEVDFTFEKSGVYPIVAHIEADRLARDDNSYAVALVRDGLRTLVVDGDPGQGRFSGESGFLLTAVAPRGALPSGILPRRLVGEITPKELRDVDVVLVLNRTSISAGEVESLGDFVRQGGGLAFFLGNRVKPEAYRELKLFPVALGALKEAKPRVHLRLGDDPRGGFAVYRGIEGASLVQVGFDRFFDLTPAEGAVVAARFDDAAGTPAVVESTLGKGTVAVFNLTADRDWSDWPTDPSYPIALQEWIRYLAPKRAAHAIVTAGEALTWEPAAGVAYAVLPPEGTAVPVAPAGKGTEAPRSLTFGGTHRAGFYVLQPQAKTPGTELPAGALASQVFACRRDPRDSDLEPAGESRLRAALGPAGVDFLMGRDPSADMFQRSDEGETWRWIAYAAGCVLLLELFLAWWFGRR